MRKGRNKICIYSDNIFFITGVKTLIAEVFYDKKYVIHVYPERKCLDINPDSEQLWEQMFVFTDIRNSLFSLFMVLRFGDKLVSGYGNVDDVRQMLLSDKNRKIFSTPAFPYGSLSLREREVFCCMKLRMTDNEIAGKLSLSKKTISGHRRNILSKLGIKNKIKLYKFLMETEIRED